jgi:fatty-acyl-CoA synthase
MTAVLGAMANFGVGSWAQRQARVYPDQLALVGAGRSLSYAELAGRVRRLANGLLRMGVGRGDRVAWLGPNHPAFLESMFACGLVGAAMTPLNHKLPPDRIGAILDHTSPRVLIQHSATDLAATARRQRVVITGSDGSDGSGEEPDFEKLVAQSPDDPVEVASDLDDICLLAHSSGTTGSPKAIMLTHANVTWNVVNLLSCADFRPGDTTIALAPFFRVGGTGVNVLPILFTGGTVVVPDDMSPETILRDMQNHRVTVGFGNPDLLESLARSELWPHVDLSSVRFVITGGAPVPEHLIREYLDRGVTLLQGYGLSEAAPVALLLDPASALRKVGSAGKPPLLVDVRVVAADGTAVAAGATGELHVRGPNVMAGYWNEPDATRDVMTSDGWLRTGDAARSDDEGYVWIVDRIADRFYSDDQPVYPGDVERVLIDNPSVADAGVVQVLAEYGRPVIAATVVLAAGTKITEDELLAFCRQRLPAHQVPAMVIFVDRLPRSSVGKLVRGELRALATSELPGDA